MTQDNSVEFAEYDRLAAEYRDHGRLCVEKQQELRALNVDVAAGLSEDLSRRERQVFQAIGRGLATPQIAQQMDLAVSTVETYRERLKQKLHLKSGPALTRYAILWVAGINGPLNDHTWS